MQQKPKLKVSKAEIGSLKQDLGDYFRLSVFLNSSGGWNTRQACRNGNECNNGKAGCKVSEKLMTPYSLTISARILNTVAIWSWSAPRACSAAAMFLGQRAFPGRQRPKTTAHLNPERSSKRFIRKISATGQMTTQSFTAERRARQSHLVCTDQTARVRKGSELRRILDRVGQYGTCSGREGIAPAT
jgi:hypothetical protein